VALCLTQIGGDNRRGEPGSPRRHDTLVLGIGNVLLGDEGVGVHALHQLEQTELAPQADMVDGGTGGFHLLELFRDYTRIILIDAAADNRPPGTVSLIRPKYAKDFPASLSAHDIGLKDLVESAALLGCMPEIDLITVTVARLQPMSMDLSPEVAAAMPEVFQRVRDCLATAPVAPE
jgi:hydrogenase maturation protease